MKIPEDKVISIFSQILEILKFLWDNYRMVHRDLKPDNLFITTNFTVILLDYGIAKIIHSSYKAETFAGTLNYQAPEYHNLIDLENYKADCWSLGLILHYLCAQSDAFTGKTEN